MLACKLISVFFYIVFIIADKVYKKVNRDNHDLDIYFSILLRYKIEWVYGMLAKWKHPNRHHKKKHLSRF